MYPKLFFDIIVVASVVALTAVFAFQVWVFTRDWRGNDKW